MTRKFLRGKWRTYSKLGRGRKKKQKYRKARGRHNKIRENNKGNPRKVEIGYKQQKKEIESVIVAMNVKDLKKIEKGQKIAIGKIGKKKKIEIVKQAEKDGVIITNLNVKKFMQKTEKDKLKKQEQAKTKVEKKKAEERKEDKKKKEKKNKIPEKVEETKVEEKAEEKK